jgi:hypothetical protein
MDTANENLKPLPQFPMCFLLELNKKLMGLNLSLIKMQKQINIEI